MKYLYGEDARLVPWAEARLAGQRFRDDARTIGAVAGDGTIRAVVVYDNFSPQNCYIAVASDGSRRWFTRELRVRSLAYPFIQCDFPRITALISERNHESLLFIQGFDSFKREGRVREAGPDGEDLILWGLLRRESRWLPGSSGHQSP